MQDQYARTRLLLGDEGVEKLRRAKVLIFGLGGVGGYAAEALARSGIGHIGLVDHDTVSLTNLNRQILALHSSVGQYKVDVAAQRIKDIDLSTEVRPFRIFYLPETADQFDFSEYDYIIDAIDTVTGKLQIISRAKECGVPVISCMGTGNKLDATGFRVADISKTDGCPLARIMRKECAKRGIKHVKVVYSPELPIALQEGIENEAPSAGRRSLPGSSAFVPGVAGLILASEVVKDIINA